MQAETFEIVDGSGLALSLDTKGIFGPVGEAPGGEFWLADFFCRFPLPPVIGSPAASLFYTPSYCGSSLRMAETSTVLQDVIGSRKTKRRVVPGAVILTF